MAKSFARSIASGSTDTFSIPFAYLDKSHVNVYLNGVALAPTAYTWPTQGSIQLVAGSPAVNTVVERRRNTPTDPITTFVPGNLDTTDLNVASLQPLFLAQEADDDAQDILTRGWTTTALATGGTITKGPEGSVPQFDADGNLTDYVEAGDIDDAAGNALAAAASAAAAAISEDNAEASEIAANADAIQTGLDRTAASGSASAAASSASAASGSASAASGSASAAAGSASTASTQAGNASASATAASGSATAASGSASTASTQATNAGNSATAAAGSAAAAATSASTAASNVSTALSGRTINTTNGITGGGNLGADKTLTLEAQLGKTYAVITDAKPATPSSGRYQTNAGATNAPDAANGYFYDVISNGGGYAQATAYDTANPNRIWTASQVAGTWTPWALANPKNLLTWGADVTGSVSATAAINAACAFQTGRLIGTAAFASIPQAPVIDLVIPAGVWHVATLVDTGNKNVTYFIDENATFTSGSMDNLNGAKIVRKNRTTSNQMSGVLDSANVKSAMGGDGAADRSPLVNGITNVNQIASIDTWDAVTDYVDITGVALTHTSTATFTSSTCTLGTAINILKLRVGMVILTSNNYAGQILSWNGAGTVITVTGWYPIGSTTPGTPASGSVYFNPISEVYARNTNVFLPLAGYTYQGTGQEIGIINNKIAPTIAEDASGKTWGNDVVNLGGFRCSIGHITRGDFWEGYRATGTQVGFKSGPYTSYGYGAPSIGFDSQGSNVAFRARNIGGTTTADIMNDGTANFQKLGLFALVNAANDAAAAGAGVAVNAVYRNGSVLQIRVV